MGLSKVNENGVNMGKHNNGKVKRYTKNKQGKNHTTQAGKNRLKSRQKKIKQKRKIKEMSIRRTGDWKQGTQKKIVMATESKIVGETPTELKDDIVMAE